MNSTVRPSFKVFFCCCVSKVHAGPMNNTRDQLEKHNFAFFSCSVADALLKKKKKKLKHRRKCFSTLSNGYLGLVWYMCLKTENCYLKTFVEIGMSKKMCKNTCNFI